VSSKQAKKIIFMGTPDFAVPSLKALIAADDIEVLALITQPDKAIGRKQIMTAPPTKVLAVAEGIQVWQPAKISQDEDLIHKLKSLKPDYLITVAYGQILKENILEIAPVINVHASLLPEFRGPAPINWMLLHGDSKVGITTMLTDKGVDTGAMLLKDEMSIDETINASQLTASLSQRGAALLIRTINEFTNIKPLAQDKLASSKQLAPFMDKNLGQIDFNASELILKSANPRQSEFEFRQKNTAIAIHNLVRGTYPWPGAWFKKVNGNKNDLDKKSIEEKVIVLETRVNKMETNGLGIAPSTITKINKEIGSFTVACVESELEIIKVKAQGKSEMKALDWLNGQRLRPGDKLTTN
jgi:methionyl-tRNA formyltransferase